MATHMAMGNNLVLKFKSIYDGIRLRDKNKCATYDIGKVHTTAEIVLPSFWVSTSHVIQLQTKRLFECCTHPSHENLSASMDPAQTVLRSCKTQTNVL